MFRKSPRFRWSIRLLLLLPVILLAAHPWVIDGLARSLVSRLGGSVGSSEVTYRSLSWTDFQLRLDGTTVEIDAVEIGLIPRYLASWFGGEETFAEAGEVIVALGAASGDGTEGVGLGPGLIFEQLDQVLRGLEIWLPSVRVDAVRLSGPPVPLELSGLRWKEGRLELRELELVDLLGGELGSTERRSLEWEHLRLERIVSRIHFSATRAPDLEVHASLGFVGDEVDLGVETAWSGGRLAADAFFAPDQWRPARATVAGSIEALPTDLGPSLDALRPRVEVEGSFDGGTETLALVLDGEGLYTAPESGIETRWAAAFDLAITAAQVDLRTSSIQTPWATASLSAPLRLDRETLQPEETASLRWTFDFTASPLGLLQGSSEGSLRVEPLPGTEGLRFALNGQLREIEITELAGGPLAIGDADLVASGTGDRDLWELSEVSLEAEAVGEVSGTLRLDRTAGEAIEATLRGAFRPTILARWLEPTGVAILAERIELSLRAQRREQSWHHEGNLASTPFQIGGNWEARAAVDWAGEGLDRVDGELQLERAEVALAAALGIAREERGWVVDLQSITETVAGKARWSTQAPSALRLQDDGLGLAPVAFATPAGGQATVSFRMGVAGERQLDLELVETGAGDVAGWFDVVLPKVTFRHLDLSVGSRPTGDDTFRWEGSVSLDGAWTTPRDDLWTATGGVLLGEGGVRFDAFRLTERGGASIRVEGGAPVRFRGDASQIFTTDLTAGEPFDLSVQVDALERLPLVLERRLPVVFGGADLAVRVSGPPTDPVASFTASLREMAWAETDSRLAIEVADTVLRLEVAGAQIAMEELSLRLPEAPARSRLTGAVTGIEWASWLEEPDPSRWVELGGELHLESWPLAALGRFLPAMVQPTGEVTGHLRKNPGEWPTGEVNWDGLALVPLPSGLTLRGLSGSADLRERRLEDIDVAGKVGGKPLRLTGWVDLAELSDPLFEVALTADRLDLVRQGDMVLRAAADLQAVRTRAAETALLRGRVTLEDSIFIKDLRSFTQRGASGVAPRPPYFSVATEPLAAWRLDVGIEGAEFLRVRTPVFNGVASADFELRGTLGAPELVGRAWADRGALVFPFATLPVDEVSGYITAAEPHTLQLDGSGEGVAFGYLVQYQLGGTAESPTVQFSSVPSLPSDTILLMLATGAVPSSEGGSDAAMRAGRLAFFLGQDFFSDLIGSEGAGRLEIRSGEGFSPFRRESQVIEYQLSENWSVRGEYDDFGGYNVDVGRKLIER